MGQVKDYVKDYVKSVNIVAHDTVCVSFYCESVGMFETCLTSR